MKIFEIWCEGYRCTGESAQANFFGEIEANSFQEACNLYFDNDEDKKYYNPKTLTYWGCDLFDNEEDARKSFG